MFELPATWGETRRLLCAIQHFFDHAPIIYVKNKRHDFNDVCSGMGQSLETFLQTGLGSAWQVPIQIHGQHADWILLPCGVLPDRCEDLVLRWNARAITQPPFWAVNRPGFAAFFPHLAYVKHNTGQLDSFVWQQIWQQAVGVFFNNNYAQQLLELRSLTEEVMANTTWQFREELLLDKLTSKQKEELEGHILEDEPPAVRRKIDGNLSLPIAVFCKDHTEPATYFCVTCSQMYCENCSLNAAHMDHVFKSIK